MNLPSFSPVVNCREGSGESEGGAVYLVQSEDAEMKYTKQLGKQSPQSQNFENQVKLIKALWVLSHSVWLFVTPWSSPGSSVHWILQARILEGVAIPPPGNLPSPGLRHCRWILYHLSHQGSSIKALKFVKEKVANWIVFPWLYCIINKFFLFFFLARISG